MDFFCNFANTYLSTQNYLLMIKTIVRCMQLRSLPMGMASTLMGSACADLTGNFDPTAALLCLLFTIFAQITANLFHYYCDEKYHYGESIDDGFANTSSIGIPLEKLLREATFAFGIIALTFGFALINLAPVFGILMGILIIAAIYFNNDGPYPLCRRPWDIVLTFLFFGPVGTIGTAYIQSVHGTQTPQSTWMDIQPAVYAAVTMGLFAVNSLLFNGYRYYEKSVENSSRSFTSVFGKKASRSFFCINSILIFVISLLICFFFHFHNMILAMVVPTLCTVYNFYLLYLVTHEWDPNKAKWENMINFNMLFYALVALIEFNLFGMPQDSLFTYF